MPVIIPAALPATETLTNEQIFVMHEQRAQAQDIRPLKLAIVNLMPTKIVTETQLLRLISNTALQAEVDLIRMASHVSKNVSAEHLATFYKDFEEIKKRSLQVAIRHVILQKLEYAWSHGRLHGCLTRTCDHGPCRNIIIDKAQHQAVRGLGLCSAYSTLTRPTTRDPWLKRAHSMEV